MRILLHFARPLLPALLTTLLAVGCSEASKADRHLAKAEKYFNAGEYEKAKIEYLNVVRADQNNPVALKRMGAIWMEQGAPLRAGGFLTKAKELSPDDIPNRLRLARLYITAGGIDGARKEAEAILEQDPANEEALQLLLESARNPEEIASAEEQLKRIASKETAPFQVALATLALKKKDVVAAEHFARAALRSDPKYVAAHTTLATVRLLQNDIPKAKEEFKAAAELAPARSNERIQYAEFLARSGASAEAIPFLQAITAEAPDYIPAWRLLGQIALAEKRHPDALAILENIFKYDIENPDGRLLQAQVSIANGEPAKAVETLKRLTSYYGEWPVIHFQLANALLETGDTAQAIAALEQAIKLEPNYADAILALARVNLQSGNFAPVVSSMEAFLKQNPSSEQAQVMLADAYRAVGRAEEAATILRKQIEEAPRNPQPHLLLGVLLRQQNRTAEARESMEKAYALAPDNFMAVSQLIELDIAEKNFSQASQRVAEVLERFPNSAPAYLLKGNVHAAEKDWAQAEAAFLKVLEIDPEMKAGYEALVALYVASNDKPKAAARLEAFVQSNPANLAAQLSLGMLYSEMKEHEKARALYERVLAGKPDVSIALNNLANYHAEQPDQLDKALELAQKAHGLDPSNPFVAGTLGWILSKRGDYDRALALLTESAGKLPDNPESQFRFGMVNYMTGNLEVARSSLQRALSISPDFAGADEARQRLKLLDTGATGQGAASMADLQQIVKSQPNDIVAVTRLAALYEKEGSVANAAEMYEKALQLNPKLLEPLVKLAQMYSGPLNDAAKASEYAKRARDIAPNDPTVSALAGRISYQSGNFTRAYSLLQETARRENPDAATLHAYAWAAYSIGKVDEAVEAMDKALAANPDAKTTEDAKLFLTLVRLAANPQSIAGANADVQRALQSDPNYVPALVLQGELQLQRNDATGAMVTYNKILARFPEFAPVQKRLAALYLQDQDELEKAFDLANSARRTLPNDVELSQILGRIYYERKEYNRAIQLLQESAKQQPLDALSLFALGMAQAEVKQSRAARESLAKAVAAGLPEPKAAEANRRAAELEGM